MNSRDYIILMADIIDSRNVDQYSLMKNFKIVTDEINADNKDLLLSPITITLGDEFQGVIMNIESAVKIIFSLEEKIISQQAGFKLRFVLFQGLIETPINKEIAYGMLGEGLTDARKALENSKNNNNRYFFSLNNKNASEALTNSMYVYQTIIDGWNIKKDFDIITNFIELRDYKKVALSLNKSRSQIWKREKSLNIEQYFSIKSVINYIAENI